MPRLLLRSRWICPLAVLVLLAGRSPAQDAREPHYLWQRQEYGTLDGSPALLFGDSFRYSKLALADLNGNGRQDLLVGKEDGSIARFENEGTPAQPRWRLVQDKLTAIYMERQGAAQRAVQRPIAVGSHAAPALADIDGDGDLDLFIGNAAGNLYFFRNVGTAIFPVFEFVTDHYVPAEYGHNLVPVLLDLTGDQAPELLLGNAEGDVYLLHNSGTKRDAAICGQMPPPDAQPGDEPPCKPVPRIVASIRPEINAVPALTDWSGTGRPDLFIGQGNGTIAYYENDGQRYAPDWRIKQSKFLAIDEGGYASPAFVPAVGTARPDLLVGSSTDNVSLYSNRDAANKLDVWKVSGNELRVRRFAPDLRRLVVTSGDVDGDGDLDLVLGDAAGDLIWVDNVGTAKEPAWHTHPTPILPGVRRPRAAPLLLDLDGDGDLDLLVGGQDGRLWLLRNTGDPKHPAWHLESTFYGGIEVGSDSVPCAVDVDGDGRLDLLVGNARGLVIYYHNDGPAQNPEFRLVTTRFGDLSVGQNAAPAAFDANQDKLPDLVVGNARGRLALALNQSAAGEAVPRKWKLISNAWEGLQGQGYATPHFADLNGDGKPDLLMGDGEGNLLLYLNGGLETPPEAGKAPGEAPAKPAEGGTSVPRSAFPAPPAPGSPNPQGAEGPQPRRAAAPAALPAAPSVGPEALLAAPTLPSGAPLLPAGPDQASLPAGPLAPVYVLESEKFGDIQVQGKAVPAFADLDGDGDLDLLIAAGKGGLVYYQNLGNAKRPQWKLERQPLASPTIGRNSSIVLTDLDGDGLVDLLVGTEDGHALFYRNAGTRSAPRFVLIPGALASINVGRNAAPTVALLGQDKKPGLLVGSFSGNLFAYGRDGGAQSLNFKLLDRLFLGRNLGVTPSPFMGDMDKDGAPELLVGSDQGAVTYFTPVPISADNPWGMQPGPDYLKGLKFPAGSSPRLADIDGDGFVDLFVGSEQGTVYFYHNTAGGAAGLNP